MNLVCGVDGCKGGWIAVLKDLSNGEIFWRFYTNAQNLIYTDFPYHLMTIDIPIGLPERGPRICDREAREFLGPGRASSVFPAPIRPVLAATNYEEACRIRFQVEGKKMSRQAWAIVSKIREVDEVLRKDVTLQSRVREVHPEVSFYHLAGGQPMKHCKKRRDGKDERRKILEPIFSYWLKDALTNGRTPASAEDDILDAFAALWTAERIAIGMSLMIPTNTPRDSFGLFMEIVA